MNDFDVDIIIRNIPFLWEGLKLSFFLAALSSAACFSVSSWRSCACRRSSPVAFFALCYVNFFRSVPLLLFFFWFYFMVPLTLKNDGTVPFETAYYCEIIRAGVQSIPRGQVNAGLSIWPVSLGNDALHRDAAGVPEHAADLDDAAHHPVSGYVARVCLATIFMTLRQHRGQSGTVPGRNVYVRAAVDFVYPLSRVALCRVLGGGAVIETQKLQSYGTESPGPQELIQKILQGRRSGGRVRTVGIGKEHPDQVRQRAGNV